MCRVKAKGVGKKKKGKDTEVRSAEEDEFENKELVELDYCQMINRSVLCLSLRHLSSVLRCLPNEIRVIGWTEVTPEFSARFSATSRTYRYFFLKSTPSLSPLPYP
jgi:hypothetical protein